jgi:hypothetical protein
MFNLVPIMQQYLIFRFRFAIVWALVILFACGAQPSTFAELRLEDLFGYDKPIHAFLFGFQAWLLIQASLKTARNTRLLITISCLMSASYGVFIELLQKWVFTGRSYDYFDMLANSIGCLIVYFIALKKLQHV